MRDYFLESQRHITLGGMSSQKTVMHPRVRKIIDDAAHDVNTMGSVAGHATKPYYGPATRYKPRDIRVLIAWRAISAEKQDPDCLVQ
jgi:hypothetical protein